MSHPICPMLSALPPAGPDGKPVNRECLLDECRFYDTPHKDCSLAMAARETARLASAEAARNDKSLQAAVMQAGQAADRIAALESTVNGLGAALAGLETQMASILEVQQKVADRLLEEMSLLLALTQKGDAVVGSLASRLDRSEEASKAILDSLETRRRKDTADLEGRRRDEAVACNNRGVALYYRGAFDAARDAFLKAIDLQAEYPEALNNLGLVYSRLGSEQEAIEAFRKALTLDPKMGEAYNNLGFLYHTSSQFDRAAQMFGMAIENAGDSSVAYTNLGNTLYAMKQSEKAVEAWRRAVELDPMNESARRGLTMFQQEAGSN